MAEGISGVAVFAVAGAILGSVIAGGTGSLVGFAIGMIAGLFFENR